jgi:pimeloyl-ACP methyl ester carboxylesterase
VQLEVPGASLRYDVTGCGPVLLLIPGGPGDGAAFSGLTPLLVDGYTVVTYDPRGISRSSVMDRDADIGVATQAADAAHVLAAVTPDPAYVFGSGGGAITGLELVTRHPRCVRLLVPHEPPLIELLPDRKAQIAGIDDVADTYRRQGASAGLRRFMVVMGMAASAEPIPPAMLPNLEFFFARMMRAIMAYQADVAALHGSPIAVAVGAASAGQLANRSGLALAERLGVAATEFPGGHTGFVTDTETFAATLRRLLGTA